MGKTISAKGRGSGIPAAIFSRRGLLWTLAAAAGLFIVFGLLGYFWLPGFAKARLEAALSDALHRPVTVQSIEVQPYALTATVRGFRIGERPGRVAAGSTETPPLLAFNELFVDLSLSSLSHRAPVISEVRLSAPSLHFERDADGRYSVSDLVDEWLSKPDDGQKTLFSVANIQIEGGRIEFVDHPKASHRQEISEISVGIPFIANFASDLEAWVEPRFSARVNGAPLALSGKARPFADTRQASLALKLKDFDLTRIDEYSPVPLAARLVSARLDTDLSLTFEQMTGKTPGIALTGDVALKQVELVEAGADEKSARRLFRLPRLAVKLGKVDAGGMVAIEHLRFDSPEIAVRRTRDGRIDWLSLLPAAPAAAPAAPAAAGGVAATPASPAAATRVTVGEVSVVKGKLSFDDDAAETPFATTVGEFDFKLTGLDSGGNAPATATLGLGDVSLKRRGDSAALLTIGRLAVDATRLDLPARQIEIGAVSLAALRLTARRERDGRLDLARLAPPAAAVAAGRASKTAAGEGVAPWKIRLNKFALAHSALRFEDRTLASVVPFVVDPMDLSVDTLDLAGAVPAKFTLAAKVNRRGQLQTSGSLAWAPVAADLKLDLKNIDLVPLQGWAADQLNALITRGAVSFRGGVKATGTPLNIAVRGEGRLTDFNVLDKANATDLLRWRSLDVGGINLATQPLKVDLASVALSDFFARIIISPAGRLNLRDIVRSDQTPAETPAPTADAGVAPARVDPAATAPPAQAATSTAVVAAKGKANPIRIGRISLQGGNVNFSDRFIKPNYSANLTALAGRIGPLNPGTPGEVDIRGAVDGSAPLEIRGTVDPFGSELTLDIAAKAKGIDLPTFSPYSGKYVGYAIEKGKLSVDVKYRVEHGELTAENNIFLDQLTFGQKVESPDALSIPVNLAVALLKNSRGEIDINLPISGAINDPQFSLGGIIIKVIVNLIVKAVTSPFALLGSLFGGGEELSLVEFAPGRAAIAPEAGKRLQSLGKALADRPGLKLEIVGRADPENDREGLKRAVLERRVKARKLAESARRGEAGGSLSEVQVSPEEYPKYLELAYKDEKFPKPKNLIGFAKSLPVPEMEQLMLANIQAGEEEMRQLADRRARAARDWLVEKGEIVPERVFVLASKVEAEADGKKLGSRAEFSLR